MNIRYTLINFTVCATVGGPVSAFTPAKWLAVSLWLFAVLFLNGSFAYYEDAYPGGFDNPDGSATPSFAKGMGAVRFWLSSLVVSFGAAALGLYVQFA